MSLAVVTGANRGIGLALAEALVARGTTVIGACRSSSAALQQLGVEVVDGIDVTSEASVRRLAEAVGQRSVDLLINNAGILIWGDRLDAVDFDGVKRQFDTNAVGPLRVTLALRARLRPGAKVGLITSRTGSIENNGSSGAYGYRMSKAALNMAGKSLAVDLRPFEVAVAILHPGMVKTDMIGDRGKVEPAEAARGLLARIDELTLETSGGFWHANGERLPW